MFARIKAKNDNIRCRARSPKTGNQCRDWYRHHTQYPRRHRPHIAWDDIPGEVEMWTKNGGSLTSFSDGSIG